MWFYSADYLRQVKEWCDKFDVLLICDEIATGFGRTGKLWAVEHAEIEPDIMCIGKAITGGYMSFAATMTSARIAEGICSCTLLEGTYILCRTGRTEAALGMLYEILYRQATVKNAMHPGYWIAHGIECGN